MIECRLPRLMLLALWLFLLAVGNATGAEKKKSGEAAGARASPARSRSLGSANGWAAYAYKEKSGQVCYLGSRPEKSEPASAKRKPTVTVTHRPEEKVANVVSFVEGYPLKEGSDATLDIDGTKFELFTKEGTAWARTPELDKAIVEAMVKGKRAVLKAIPQKGPATTDSYSLIGFTEALAMIDKACGIKR
jgi:hypothetical protein